MTLEVCHRLTPLLIPWSLLVRLLHKSFVKKQYINRNMSYLSERQCQFCVDRAVASTESRLPGLPMHNALGLHLPTHLASRCTAHLAFRCTTHLAFRCTAHLAFRCKTHGTPWSPYKLVCVRPCLYLYAAQMEFSRHESWNL
jgi:hypothetical protein